ncbi:uncharacterized protein N7477_002333 [Penicillium maclennaniae]|uniref:uncharacterized protein n=1 Tax=Penicillium maclennaniae TaxID=1343394 RepID=UPI002541EDBC|nr:uncharacterized protein N7477_002333 [Penicillium maclennaniae]KAJ5676700.1 hypothetical protein N7477_002333 [Penicillium maclennaniae]
MSDPCQFGIAQRSPCCRPNEFEGQQKRGRAYHERTFSQVESWQWARLGEAPEIESYPRYRGTASWLGGGDGPIADLVDADGPTQCEMGRSIVDSKER